MFVEMMRTLEFPDEAVLYLSSVYSRIRADEELSALLDSALSRFCADEAPDYKLPLESVAAELEIPRYTADAIMLVLAMRGMRNIYRERGIEETVWLDTAKDLRNKLIECKRVYGCWGCFVTWWFKYHLGLRLFTLGRLQYEPIAFPFDDYKGILKKGDRVYSCHIPADGPLTETAALSSLERAYEFFGGELKGNVLPVYCDSWLIYPPHAHLYAEDSNLLRFYRMFDIIGETEDETLQDFWRIFSLPYSPETLANAPENTGLQRVFKKYLMEGGKMGKGHGIILFDGKRIIE